jgi:hypothetical protein
MSAKRPASGVGVAPESDTNTDEMSPSFFANVRDASPRVAVGAFGAQLITVGLTPARLGVVSLKLLKKPPHIPVVLHFGQSHYE